MKHTNFANGFDCFCTECGTFFNVEDGSDDFLNVEYCPYCGCDEIILEIDGFLEYLESRDADPINFYKAFPRDEPIPQSRTGATPKQVEWIMGCIIHDKQRELPVTAEKIAADLGFDIDIVKKVFEELHITETGGNK